MSADPTRLDVRCARMQATLASATNRPPPPAALVGDAIELAREALQTGRPEFAVPTLERLIKVAPSDAVAWQLLGFAQGAEQRIPEAVPAFARAAQLDPRNPQTAMAYAQASLDAGFPATQLFERAIQVAPGNLTAVKGWATALAAEGRPKSAEDVLADTLARHPEWLAGHQSLAALRFTSGDSHTFARSYAAACTLQPQNLPLRLAWFGVTAQTHDWPAALEIVEAGERLIGTRPAFAAARALIASESGDHARADEWFARTADSADDALRIAHVRHCLRTGQLEQAERLAETVLQGPSRHQIWPYLSLIWRLRGDARAEWLDGNPPHIRATDLDLSRDELQALASCLRRLHTARGAHLEQSVRGGTQTDTDRQLFYRAEPEIRRIRTRVCAAIREYVASLPPHVPGHPLLEVPRERILFSGSWSVRLRGRGFHVSHTHPMGWISSALYVSLPEPGQFGAAPAGWIRFGSAPAALGLNVGAYTQIEPKPGLLVLFPSTLWHETLPFDDGERLVIAFDVMRAKLTVPQLNASAPHSPM